MTADVWVLDRLRPEWESIALCAALHERDVEAEIVDWSTLAPGGTMAEFYRDGDPVRPPRLALVRSRVLTRHTEGDAAMLYDWLSCLEGAGVRLVNDVASLRRCQNKVWQAAVLASAGVPVPQTRAVACLADVDRCLGDWGETVLKPVYGHASIDLVRIRPGGELAEAGSLLGVREEIVVWHLLRRYHWICAQRFVPNPGRDLRVIVIDSWVASCHYRSSTAPDGDVKSLLHPYRREPAQVTEEIERISMNVVDVLGLDIATIDLVESYDGPVVIEVNPTVSVWESLQGTPMDLTPSGITDSHACLLHDLLATVN